LIADIEAIDVDTEATNVFETDVNNLSTEVQNLFGAEGNIILGTDTPAQQPSKKRKVRSTGDASHATSRQEPATARQPAPAATNSTKKATAPKPAPKKAAAPKPGQAPKFKTRKLKDCVPYIWSDGSALQTGRELCAPEEGEDISLTVHNGLTKLANANNYAVRENDRETVSKREATVMSIVDLLLAGAESLLFPRRRLLRLASDD
jgi:hypothetical protein